MSSSYYNKLTSAYHQALAKKQRMEALANDIKHTLKKVPSPIGVGRRSNIPNTLAAKNNFRTINKSPIAPQSRSRSKTPLQKESQTIVTNMRPVQRITLKSERPSTVINKSGVGTKKSAKAAILNSAFKEI
jgi:hypothetical protein